MHLKISHTTGYHYDQPVHYALQRLRLTPLSGPGQKVISWSLRMDHASQQASFIDHFGNRTELWSTVEQPKETFIIAEGEIETEDRAGVVGAHGGFCPLWLFLRDTPLTTPGDHIRALASELAGIADPLACMHGLMGRLNDAIAYRTGETHSETTAEEALASGAGVCQDHAHAMIATARLLDIPARYVSGYLYMDGIESQTASHAWAEVHLPGLGWVGFDAANRICPDGRYVRIATGLDYQGAAPVSGLRLSAASERLSVALTVRDQNLPQGQAQSQS
nr:transglutaminase family protein [uncultured Gellertiella sp.]